MHDLMLLHPYRKRKFFVQLAEFLHEEIPICHYDNKKPTKFVHPSQNEQTDLKNIHSQEELSYQMVELHEQQEQHRNYSCSEIQHDSISLFPSNTEGKEKVGQDQILMHEHPWENLYPLGQIMTRSRKNSIKQQNIVHSSWLSDYYDSDRLCEINPCWSIEMNAECCLHSTIRYPLLFFSIQVMDEYISLNAFHEREDSYAVTQCKIARLVFLACWNSKNTTADLATLQEYVDGRKELVGVGIFVWKVIGKYWEMYKHTVLHHKELFFDEGGKVRNSLEDNEWVSSRSLLEIFGLKMQQAKTLVSQNVHNIVDLCDGNYELSKVQEFGVKYLDDLNDSKQKVDSQNGIIDQCSSPFHHRGCFSQSDWQTAFKAVEIHLKNAFPSVKVYACGAFSRGCLFGSVLDILVVDLVSTSCSSTFNVLEKVGIVKLNSVTYLSDYRGVAVIHFRSLAIILDVKVYNTLPKGAAALLYFTGPEHFLRKKVLPKLASFNSFVEIQSSINFDQFYQLLEVCFCQSGLNEINSELDLFKLIGLDFIVKSKRI